MMPLNFALRATVLFFVFFVLQLTPIYHPATIDEVGYVNWTDVQVSGIVGGVDREDGVVSFRLTDVHGHYRRCVLPKGMDPPKVGATIWVKGTRKLYPANWVVELDPVFALGPVEE